MIALPQWVALDDASKRVLLDGLLERLPPWLSLVDAAAPLALFEDTRHAQRFVFVPGTAVTIGLTPARFEAIVAAIERDPLQLFSPEVALPAREVTVPAHFAATSPMVFERHAWVPRTARPRLLPELTGRGWRLPSEAEWEVHFREVHPRLPLPSMLEGELCLDDWHIGYDGAPADASPRGQSAEVVRQAAADPGDLRSILPARLPVRSAGGACARPVIDFPR